MRKILVAYDGSKESKQALEMAASLGDGPELTIIGVAPLTYAVRGGGAAQPHTVEEHRTALEEARAWLADRGREATVVEVVADPADAIVDTAEQGDFDLIVLGSRGLNTVQRFLIGSTSSRVVAHAPCSVLVVR